MGNSAPTTLSKSGAENGEGANTPLDGCHAVITGGGRGIGAAIADRLASMGARLTLAGHDDAALDALVFRIEERYGVPGLAVRADVTQPREVDILFANALEVLGPATILINNAGAAESAPFPRTGLGLWHEMLAANATSAFLCAQAALPAMQDAGWGRIVTITSSAALKGYPEMTACGAAEHAVLGLTRHLAAELAHDGITVNAVCAGHGNLIPPAATAERLAGGVADAVARLCHPDAGAITGQAISVAGNDVA